MATNYSDPKWHAALPEDNQEAVAPGPGQEMALDPWSLPSDWQPEQDSHLKMAPHPERSSALGEETSESLYNPFTDERRAESLTKEATNYDDAQWFAEYQPPPAEVDYESWEEDPYWSDYGRMLGSSLAGVGSGFGWLLKKIGAEDTGEAIQRVSSEASQSWINDQLDVIGMTSDGLSEQAKYALYEQELLGESKVGGAKFNKLKLLAVGAIPGTIVGAAGGIYITAGLRAAGMAAKAAGMIGFSTGEALVASTMSGASTEEQVRDMSIKELNKSIEFRASMAQIARIQRMKGTYDESSEKEREDLARDLVARAAGNEAAAITAITTAILSAPFGATLEKLYRGGAAAGKSVVERAVGAGKGMAVESSQEFLQSGSEKVAQNVAMIGIDPNMTGDKIFEGALEEALAGAGAGAMMGGVAGLRVDEQGAAERAYNKLTPEQQNQVDEMLRVQEEAEAASYANGGDALDSTVAGEEAATDVATSIINEINAREDLMSLADEIPDIVQQERQTRGIKRQKALSEPSDTEVKAEIETELTREQVQEEAAGRYEAQKISEARGEPSVSKDEAFEKARAEKLAKRKVDEQDADLQREMEKGEQIEGQAKTAAEPDTQLGTKLKEAKDKNLTGRRVLEAEKAKPPLLEDMRPSVIVVDPKGASRAMTAAEFDAQVKRRETVPEQQEMGLEGGRAATSVPVSINGIDINITDPKGTAPTGTDGVHSGTIKGLGGPRGMDVLIGESDWRPVGQKAWVVNEYNEDGQFTGHKVMLGFGNEQEATDAFDRNRGEGIARGETAEMTVEELKTWGKGDNNNKPVLGDEALTLNTEEGLESAQDRATFKGGKKPKILFAQADVTVEEVAYTEDAEALGLIDENGVGPDSTILQAKDKDGPVGNIVMNRRGSKMQIVWTMVKQGMRGMQIGQKLLVSALRKANAMGHELVSDSSVSVAQLRVYETLRKQGKLVVEYSDPAAVHAALEKYKDDPDGNFSVQLGAMQPVIKRMFIPEFQERIQLRKSDDMVSESVETDKVRNVINLLLDFMPGIQGKVTVVETAQDLPMEYFAYLANKGQLDARGFHDSNTGDIFIIAENNTSNAQAINTFMHEAVGHYGLRKVFGAELDPLLDEIWEKGPRKAIQAMADRYGADTSTPEGRRLAVEEYIAHLAETRPSDKLLDKIVNWIRGVLKNAGILDTWTDNDIHSLLRDVRRELRYKPLNKIKITTEAEIEETGEVVTLEQSAEIAMRRHRKRTDSIKKLKACLS